VFIVLSISALRVSPSVSGSDDGTFSPSVT